MRIFMIGMLAMAIACLSGSTATAEGKGTPFSVTGHVEVLQSCDFETHQSEKFHYIVDENTNKAYQMRLNAATRKALRAGARVKVKGQLINDELVVNDDSSAITTYSAPQDEAAMRGANSIAVIIVDFKDSAVTGSPAQIASVMFGDPSNPGNPNIADYYLDSSFGQFTFAEDSNADGVQDVFGPFTVNYSTSDPTNYYGWAYEAEAAAAAAGIDLSPFQHRLFVVPSNTSAPWWGIANVGLPSTGFSRAWITRWDKPDLYAHELGHNLFLRHATTDTNNDGVVEQTYGDLSCIMGYSGVGYRELNAPHKVQMGWFDAYPNNVVTVQSGGTYYIAPLELNPWETDLPQVLRVYKQNTNEYYYLSYRMQIDYDAALRTNYLNGVNIHKHAGGAVETKFIRVLQNGGSFEDTANSFGVTQLSYNPDPMTGYVEVSIDFSCTANNLTASISPTTAYISAGASKEYSVSVKNNDAANCGATTFTVSPGVPAGWTLSNAQTSVSVNAGATGTARFTVTAPASAADGTYVIDALVSAADGQHGSSSLEALCTIDSSGPTPVTSLSAALQRKGDVLLEWNASSSAASYRILRDAGAGWIQIAETSAYSYKDNDTNVSTQAVFSYTAIACNVQGNESDAGNVASITVVPSTKKIPPGLAKK